MRLIVEGHARQAVRRRADPRVKSSGEQLARQLALAIRIRDRITDVVDGAVRIENSMTQIEQRVAQAKDQTSASAGGRRREAVCARSWKHSPRAVRSALPRGPVLARSADEALQPALTMNSQVQTGEYEPTRQHVEMVNEWSGKVGVQLRLLQALEDAESQGSIACWGKCRCL